MHRRLQFDMRENPASNRRHGSRLAITNRSNEDYSVEESGVSAQASSKDNHQPTGADTSQRAASHPAATGGEKMNESRLLTVHEVAGILQVPTSWVYAHTRKRSAQPLPGYRLGKYWRFRQADIFAWIERQRGGVRGS